MSAGARIAMGAAFMTALMVIPAFFHDTVRSDRKETEEDEDAGWVPWHAIGMGAQQFAGMIPMLGSLVFAMRHKIDPKATSVDPLMASVYAVWQDIVSKKVAKQPVAHAARAAAFVAGVPGVTNQVVDTFSFWNQVHNEQIEPETKMQWARGILAIQDKGKNP
jgi:hypothetical protein